VAVRVQRRLFTSKPIHLGVEESLKHPDAPCGLNTDAERARHVRSRVKQMLNSRGEWQVMPRPQEVPVGEVFVHRSTAELARSAPGSDRGKGRRGDGSRSAAGKGAGT